MSGTPIFDIALYPVNVLKRIDLNFTQFQYSSFEPIAVVIWWVSKNSWHLWSTVFCTRNLN